MHIIPISLYRTLNNLKPIVLMQKWSIDQLMLISAVVAVLFHILFIFGIRFSSFDVTPEQAQDVVIQVQLKKDDPVKDAEFLSTSDATGGGTETKATPITSPDMSLYQHDSIEQVNPNASMEAKANRVDETQTPVLYTTLNWVKAYENREKLKKQQEKNSQDSVQSTAAMIATLEAEYAKQKQELTKDTGIKTVSSLQTKSDTTAPYVTYFKKTVEKIGNRYYPAEAKRLKLSGDVRLMVVLKPNGEIKAIKVLKHSKFRILDEAAKESVRNGAPYKKFPAVMNDLNELRIIRTWRFTAATQSTTVMDE